MRFVWLFCALLSLGLPCDLRKSSLWINSLTKYIGEETNAHQVVLISNLSPEKWFKSPVIDELFHEIVKKFPTVRINIETHEEPKSCLQNTGNEKHITTDTSETFFIVIDETHTIPDPSASRKLIDDLLPISDLKLQSRFLLLQVSSVLIDTFEDLLRYAWSKKLLDFTIIEMIDIRNPKKLIGIDYSIAQPIVHQWNPFKKEYWRKNWSPNIGWFLDKVSNMWGYSLKVGVLHREPFSRVDFDDNFMPINVGGANIAVWKIISLKLNFSMHYLPRLDKFLGPSIIVNPQILYDSLEIGKMDLMAYLVPHYTESLRHNTMRTSPILFDELCPIVPVLPRKEIPFPVNSIKAYLCSFALVTIFWLLRLMLRFDELVWQPFNILRIIFGKSVTRLPIKFSEQILCASLLIVSAIYSTNIYKSLTDIILQSNVDMEFETFDDLDKSGLVPIINRYLFKKTFLHPDESMMKIRDKCIHHPITECPEIAAVFKNVTCFRRHDEALGLVEDIERSGIGKIKIAKCCFWWDSTAFLLAKGSPYRTHFNRLIARMHSVGLILQAYDDRGYRTFRIPTVEEKDAEFDINRNTNVLRQQLVAIGIVGYRLSAVAFIGEIVVYNMQKKMYKFPILIRKKFPS